MWILGVLAFVFGTSIASFANMWSYRHPAQGGLPKKLRSSKRSFCDYCHRQLSWWENIPILSFIILRGKTHCCHRSLSWRYPVVEFVGGLMGIFLLLGIERRILLFPFITSFPLSKLIMIVVISLLFILSLLIFSYDLFYYFIPLSQLIGVIVLSFIFWLLSWPLEMGVLIGVGFNFGLMLLLYLITRGKGLGLGDLLLVIFFPFVLGWIGGVFALWLSFVLGAVVGLVLILFAKNIGLKSIVPLGPFLIFSFWLSWAFNWWRLLLK